MSGLVLPGAIGLAVLFFALILFVKMNRGKAAGKKVKALPLTPEEVRRQQLVARAADRVGKRFDAKVDAQLDAEIDELNAKPAAQ